MRCKLLLVRMVLVLHQPLLLLLQDGGQWMVSVEPTRFTLFSVSPFTRSHRQPNQPTAMPTIEEVDDFSDPDDIPLDLASAPPPPPPAAPKPSGPPPNIPGFSGQGQYQQVTPDMYKGCVLALSRFTSDRSRNNTTLTRRIVSLARPPDGRPSTRFTLMRNDHNRMEHDE